MARDDLRRCYICDRALMGRFEWDHFPIPQSAGGKDVLPICRDCHDIKDRLGLGTDNGWDAGVAFGALAGLWTRATVEERLLFAKMLKIMGQQAVALSKVAA